MSDPGRPIIPVLMVSVVALLGVILVPAFAYQITQERAKNDQLQRQLIDYQFLEHVRERNVIAISFERVGTPYDSTWVDGLVAKKFEPGESVQYTVEVHPTVKAPAE